MGISCKRNSRTEQVQRDKSCACNLFARHCFVPLLLQEENLIKRIHLTSGHDVPKWEDFDKSDRQVRRYIRLTELVTPLLDKVDDKSIPVSAGTELSFLNVKV